ncbi:hypothetical protein Caci_4232 [Catenulispora acidiphila DSM 44928]|uniref:Uncharacterized protein n=1 Tax=Catenulispora acidiphila (strain DSM 44928 / JCM 14897 / NBRC 102108 / NRRL B-24433 / ID139908) TaxID=479433 RepID=C7QI51_CATAD|nr:hypothetical protein [Catenulispora acidiphila]ACU73096.1 hypothetical protein Caci_4232 [Catenulispora acidiphila DSM 44928]
MSDPSVHEVSGVSTLRRHDHHDHHGHHHGNDHDRDAADARTARFGALPDRVAFEDMVQEQPALPANQAVDSYDADGLNARFSCLAVDLGL